VSTDFMWHYNSHLLFFLLNLSSGPLHRKADWCTISIYWHLTFARSRFVNRAGTRITSHVGWISELCCVYAVHINFFFPLFCLYSTVQLKLFGIDMVYFHLP
jgi:hypothetical protein